MRRLARKTAYVGVIIASMAGMLLNDEVIYAATWRAIHEEQRISLRPGMWAVAGDNLRRAATRILRSLNGLLPTWFPPSGPPVMRPAGAPYAWQTADTPARYVQVNLANGNTLVTIPITQWSGLNDGVQFGLFYNTLDPATDLGTMPLGWTHSYSRRLIFGPDCGGMGAGSGESGAYGEGASQPEGEGGESSDIPGGSTADVPGGTALESQDSAFGPEGEGAGVSSNGIWLRTDDGRRIFFSHNGDNTYNPPPGIRLKLEKLTGQPVAYMLTDARQNVDVFDASGWLVSTRDASLNTTVFTYGGGAAHRLLTITDPAGTVLSLKYCGAVGGKLKLIEAPPINPEDDQDTRQWVINYDTQTGKLTQVSKTVEGVVLNCDPAPPTALFLTFGYETPSGFLNAITNYRGVTTDIEYVGGVISEVIHPETEDYVYGGPRRASRSYAFTFYAPNPETNPCGVNTVDTATIIDERGGQIDYDFDESGRLLTITDQLARVVTTNLWRADNFIESMEGAIPGSTTTFEYDPANNLTRLEDANLHDVEMGYNSLNNLTSMTDQIGNTVSYSYTDPLNPTRVTQIDGIGTSDMSFDYGSTEAVDRGQVTGIESANQIHQGFEYDRGYPKVGSYGRMETDEGECEIQDFYITVGPTGITICNAAASIPQGGSECLSLVPDFQYEDRLLCAPPPGTQDQCPMEPCCVHFDLEGNITESCPGCGSPQPPLNSLTLSYDENDNVETAQQFAYNGGSILTTMTYDARDRILEEDVAGGEGAVMVTLFPHATVQPAHTLTRDYSDMFGQYRTTYSRVAAVGPSRSPFGIEYVLDPVGRVSQVKRYDPVGESVPEVTSYEYNDSTTLPAIREIKPSGLVTEYYVDLAGNITSVVHVRDNVELKALDYTRDAKNRVIQVVEYEQGVLLATTTYTYGDGHLTSADLDPSGTPDPNKLYWNWLDSVHMQPGDPNRLIKEERTGDSLAFRKEYWYDAGGNRLAMRVTNPTTEQVSKIVRYNYTYPVDYANPWDDDPDEVPVLCNNTPCTGEPQSVTPVPYANDGAGLGRDMLLSYNTYYPSDPSDVDFAIYLYDDPGGFGLIGRKIEINNTNAGEWAKTTTTFGHDLRGRLRTVHRQLWEEQPSNPGYAEYAFIEYYGYDWQGRRIATEICDGVAAMFTDPRELPGGCKYAIISHDYDGSTVIAERMGTGEFGEEVPDEFISTYTPGPLGLISRVAEQDDTCPETNCTYDYLADATGSNIGWLAADQGTFAFVRMDAWGNLIEPIPIHDAQCGGEPEVCEDTYGYAVQSGVYQYHGNQGYQTDIVYRGALSINLGRSTGFIHIGARYYEPATGRFLQHDRMLLDPAPTAVGQANRWVYAANDPVNMLDVRGEFSWWAALGGLLLGAVVGAIIGAIIGGLQGALWGALIGGLAGGLLAGFFAAPFAIGFANGTLFYWVNGSWYFGVPGAIIIGQTAGPRFCLPMFVLFPNAVPTNGAPTCINCLGTVIYAWLKGMGLL